MNPAIPVMRYMAMEFMILDWGFAGGASESNGSG
jgi:hypothetical protein